MSPAIGQLPKVPAKDWWGKRRVRYNIGLIVAGLLAFACYVAVVFWGISIGALPDPGAITLLTTIFQGIGYCFYDAGRQPLLLARSVVGTDL